jgi:hypothetical protein
VSTYFIIQDVVVQVGEMELRARLSGLLVFDVAVVP